MLDISLCHFEAVFLGYNIFYLLSILSLDVLIEK